MDWEALRLNRASPVPLYFQLAERIREAVRAELLPEGACLPAGREIAERAGISRMTARQALALLQRDGTLVVQPGVGTFVAALRMTYDALHLVGFAEETMRHGGTVVSRVIELTVEQPPDPVARRLALATQASVVKVVRLRFVEADAVLLETSYLPANRCPGLDQEDLESQSLYTLLETRYDLTLARASQTVEARAANQWEADLLDIQAGVPVLTVEGVTYTIDEQPVEDFRAVYRADRVSLAMESRRPTGTGVESGTSRISVVVAS